MSLKSIIMDIFRELTFKQKQPIKREYKRRRSYKTVTLEGIDEILYYHSIRLKGYEIAKITRYSEGTVSIVINGRHKLQRKDQF